MFCVPFLSVSPAALIVGIAAHMIIGMLWYSPLLFLNYWMKFTKTKADSMKMHAGHLVGSALTGATITIVLGHMLKTLSVTTCLGSIEYSTLLWLGLVATTMFSPVLWEKRPVELYLIGIAHWLVTMTTIGCIVTKL